MATWTLSGSPQVADGDVSALTEENPTITTEAAPPEGGPNRAFWTDHFHIVPRAIAVGNIVTDTIVPLDLFNAFEYDDKIWTSLTINADGVTTDAPGLPKTFQEQEGLEVNVTISAEGAASIDGNLTFVVGGVTIVVPLTAQRLSSIPFLPETGIVETLEWKTEVVEATDGTEQRMALRRRPRQGFSYTIDVEDGAERARVENHLFGLTGELVGLPIWVDQTRLAADVSVGAGTITVDSTANADYRAPGTLIVWASELDYEVLNLDAVTDSTTLTLDGVTAGSFDAVSTIVAPLRIAYLANVTRSSRQAEDGFTAYNLDFLVQDNDVELADTSAQSTYDSKVLLDDYNKGTEWAESYVRRAFLVDGGIGLFTAYQDNDVARRTSAKGWITETPAELWELRQLFHALRGKQVSFYLPTFAKEFDPVATLATGTATMDFTHISYDEHVNAAAPRNHLRVVETDGTTHEREITGSTEVSATVERVTVNTNWPSNIAVADIDYVDILELVRLDTDKVRLEHGVLAGQAKCMVPTKAVMS